MLYEREGSELEIGAVFFAGVMMIVGGVFQAIQGGAALFQDTFYVVRPNYAFTMDATVWGWIHILVGLLLVAVGINVFRSKLWARLIGIAAAAIAAISNFFFIPYYPVWAILIVAVNLVVIWALAFHGRALAEVGYDV